VNRSKLQTKKESA